MSHRTWLTPYDYGVSNAITQTLFVRGCPDKNRTENVRERQSIDDTKEIADE